MGFLTVDNSNCKAPITSIVYSVLQKMTLMSGNEKEPNIVLKRYIHRSTDNNGIDAFYGGNIYRKVGIELHNVKYAIRQKKKPKKK